MVLTSSSYIKFKNIPKSNFFQFLHFKVLIHEKCICNHAQTVIALFAMTAARNVKLKQLNSGSSLKLGRFKMHTKKSVPISLQVNVHPTFIACP